MNKDKVISLLLGLLIGCIIAMARMAAAQEETPAKPVELQKYIVEADNETKALGVAYEPEVYKPEVVSTPDDIPAEIYHDSLELLAHVVEAEAGNQDAYGKRLVVDVILNRVESPEFPDTITEVIYQKNAFSVVSNGAIDRVVPSEDTYEAVRKALTERLNYDIVFFTCEGYHPCGTPWQKVGDHYFSTL